MLGHSRANRLTAPLHAAVTSDDMIESFFDPVVYEKGAALLRMLRAFLNRDASPPLRLQVPSTNSSVTLLHVNAVASCC